ncbi:MAG: hypothetical protein J3K34DRAFT_429323 [Monoraphidium minutum]|nr:MAG: hypothetical protein J3K34DRAFT_429323 [Monoraphidium minutum]
MRASPGQHSIGMAEHMGHGANSLRALRGCGAALHAGPRRGAAQKGMGMERQKCGAGTGPRCLPADNSLREGLGGQRPPAPERPPTQRRQGGWRGGPRNRQRRGKRHRPLAHVGLVLPPHPPLVRFVHWLLQPQSRQSRCGWAWRGAARLSAPLRAGQGPLGRGPERPWRNVPSIGAAGAHTWRPRGKREGAKKRGRRGRVLGPPATPRGLCLCLGPADYRVRGSEGGQPWRAGPPSRPKAWNPRELSWQLWCSRRRAPPKEGAAPLQPPCTQAALQDGA